jgi:hypothetical protein
MRARNLILAAALALGGAACGDDGGPATPDGGGEPEPDGGPPPGSFTAFVIDQIANQTADDTDPVPYAAFATLDDPDLDNPGAYDELFP